MSLKRSQELEQTNQTQTSSIGLIVSQALSQPDDDALLMKCCSLPVYTYMFCLWIKRPHMRNFRLYETFACAKHCIIDYLRICELAYNARISPFLQDVSHIWVCCFSHIRLGFFSQQAFFLSAYKCELNSHMRIFFSYMRPFKFPLFVETLL